MKPIFSWREAVQQSSLPSTTRLVLFNLSIHMNDLGKSCYPSVVTQATETGLSKRAIVEHLEKAVSSGFLVKKTMGMGGQGWKLNQYVAAFPDDFTLLKEAPIFQEEKGGDFHAQEEATRLLSRNNVVTDGHSNSTLNSTRVNISKKIYKKGAKVSLAEWEEKVGSELCTAMMTSWIKDARANEADVAELIAEFRDRVMSGGLMQADFKATFRVWMRKGWLAKKKEDLKPKAEASSETEFWDRGMRL